jgi:hypothetical protein
VAAAVLVGDSGAHVGGLVVEVGGAGCAVVMMETGDLVSSLKLDGKLWMLFELSWP